LLRRGRNPLERALKIVGFYKEMPDWGMPPDYQERLAPDYTLDSYREGSTGRMAAWRFLVERGLTKCNAARILVSINDVMDGFVIEDDEIASHLINSEGFERLCRWGYGIRKTFELCQSEADYKEPKRGKVRWKLLEAYHESEKAIHELRSEDADLEVQDAMKRNAMFEKYLSKQKD